MMHKEVREMLETAQTPIGFVSSFYIAVFIFFLSLTGIALADEHVNIPFRTPEGVNVTSKVMRTTLILSQGYDSFNSAAKARIPGWHEDDIIMKPFAHGGVLTYAAGFALYDIAEHTISQMFHMGQRGSIAVDTINTVGSVRGILYTNKHSK